MVLFPSPFQVSPTSNFRYKTLWTAVLSDRKEYIRLCWTPWSWQTNEISHFWNSAEFSQRTSRSSHGDRVFVDPPYVISACMSASTFSTCFPICHPLLPPLLDYLLILFAMYVTFMWSNWRRHSDVLLDNSDNSDRSTDSWYCKDRKSDKKDVHDDDTTIPSCAKNCMPCAVANLLAKSLDPAWRFDKERCRRILLFAASFVSAEPIMVGPKRFAHMLKWARWWNFVLFLRSSSPHCVDQGSVPFVMTCFSRNGLRMTVVELQWLRGFVHRFLVA
jgi:hypothetical protein